MPTIVDVFGGLGIGFLGLLLMGLAFDPELVRRLGARALGRLWGGALVPSAPSAPLREAPSPEDVTTTGKGGHDFHALTSDSGAATGACAPVRSGDPCGGKESRLSPDSGGGGHRIRVAPNDGFTHDACLQPQACPCGCDTCLDAFNRLDMADPEPADFALDLADAGIVSPADLDDAAAACRSMAASAAELGEPEQEARWLDLGERLMRGARAQPVEPPGFGSPLDALDALEAWAVAAADERDPRDRVALAALPILRRAVRDA